MDDYVIIRAGTVDQIAEALRQRILHGDLKPGTRLQEQRLAGAFGVARNSVREALRLLAGEGLVTMRMGQGASVATLSWEDVSEIYEIRRDLELRAVRHCSQATATRLSVIADKMLALHLSDQTPLLIDTDFLFHQHLVDGLGNSRLSSFFGRILAELRIPLCLLDEEDPPDWVEQHGAIASLLLKGSYEEAWDILDTHFAATRLELQHLLSPAKQPAQ